MFCYVYSHTTIGGEIHQDALNFLKGKRGNGSRVAISSEKDSDSKEKQVLYGPLNHRY